MNFHILKQLAIVFCNKICLTYKIIDNSEVLR